MNAYVEAHKTSINEDSYSTHSLAIIASNLREKPKTACHKRFVTNRLSIYYEEM